MNFSKSASFLSLAAWSVFAFGSMSVAAPALKKASVASIKPQDLVEYATMEPRVQKLVREALALTTKGLGYRYGSNSPKNKGMDCSGTVQHTLNAAGLSQIPRSSYTRCIIGPKTQGR
ncbi:C40 family peptidase [bacterium]|nr:C40 family peptidase [bacterium]